MGCITSCARASPWTDLPPELQLEVSGRLQHAEDVVRFHAVCRSWHDAAALLAPVATRPCSCLPWVLTSCNNGQMVHSIINFRCSPETPTCRRGQGHFVLPNPSGAPPTNARNWIASVDGMAAWFFSDHPESRLVHVHTGAVTRLPPLPDKTKMAMDNFRGGGVVYKDGTVFLYSFGSRPRSYSHRHEPAETDFTAAILCPGEAAWTIVKRRLDLLPQSYAMYHDGKVLVWAGGSLWCPGFKAKGGEFDGSLESRWDVDEDTNYFHECSYMLESHGELLWASVQVKKNRLHYGYGDPPRVLRVTVRALQKEPGSGKVQWVARDGRSLGNDVLFLGCLASFATQPDIDGGGCVYFVFRGGVFRYNFVDNKTMLVKWLPLGWTATFLWLRPDIQFTHMMHKN